MFTVAVPLLIGTVLEPQLLGLSVLAPPELLVSGRIFFFLGLVVAFGGVFYLARVVEPVVTSTSKAAKLFAKKRILDSSHVSAPLQE